MEKHIFDLMRNEAAESFRQAHDLLEVNFATIDVNWKDDFSKRTLFYYACFVNAIPIIKLLLRHPKININFACYKTPLEAACSKGHLDVVKLLLDDERIDLHNRATPLHVASYYKQPTIVHLLLNDKRIDPCKTDSCGDTALHDACRMGCVEIVKLLIDDGRIDVNQKNKDGVTALTHAIQGGRKNCTKQILASGKAVCDLMTDHRGIQSLLEDYKDNPKGVAFNLRIELGLNKTDAASLFTSGELLCDGYFKLKISTELATRFYKILQSLPLELKMLICNRLYQVKTQFISQTLINQQVKKLLTQ
jgi:ankyrin repeat protein